MADDFTRLEGSKQEAYEFVISLIKGLLENEKDKIANLANVAAVLKTQFNWWWVGFYLVKEGELVLGPFQGPLACTRISFGKGVCGAAWEQQQTLIVPDVDAFAGHIACSSLSRSEIVVPIRAANGSVAAVLDADSEHLAHFDEVDKTYLEIICSLISL